jgi:hypothetical protein
VDPTDAGVGGVSGSGVGGVGAGAELEIDGTLGVGVVGTTAAGLGDPPQAKNTKQQNRNKGSAASLMELLLIANPRAGRGHAATQPGLCVTCGFLLGLVMQKNPS